MKSIPNERAILATGLTLLLLLSMMHFERLRATPDAETVYLSNDSWVQSVHPDGNYDNDTYGGVYSFLVRSNEYIGDARAFVKADLSILPPGLKIDYAKLYLYDYYSHDSAGRKYYCYRVADKDWKESTITWNNKPYLGDDPSWASVPPANNWVSFDVTSNVRAFLARDSSGYKPNYGWYIKDDIETSGNHSTRFVSSEGSSNLPHVEIVFWKNKLEIVGSSSLQQGSWTKLTIYRKDYDGADVIRGSLEVLASTLSPSGRFALTEGGDQISQITIPNGYSSAVVWYSDARIGTSNLTFSSKDYSRYYYTQQFIITVNPLPDSTPPVTAISVGSAKYQSDTTLYVSGTTVFSLSATDEGSGVRSITYRIDGSSWNSYTRPFTLSSYSEGSHTIGYLATDLAGNKEMEKILVVYLDKAPPSVNTLEPSGTLTMMSDQIEFRVSVDDDGSGIADVELVLDGLSQGFMLREGDSFVRTVTLTSGTHRWEVRAQDQVGNMAETSIMEFNLTVLPVLGLAIAGGLIIVLVIASIIFRKKLLQILEGPPPPPPTLES